MIEATGPTARWSLIGHSGAVSDVASQIEAGNPAHAWLITGPEGVGRTTFARTLAMALCCERPAHERPCHSCDTCRRIASGNHPDITLVDLEWQAGMISAPRGDASRTRQRISIEAIRWLRQDIVTRPVMGRWKVQIIDDAELLSESAPDAFLKTLEEPPPYAVIILIASSPDAVAETIRSRCRHIALGMVSTTTIREALEARGTPAAAAAAIARGAHGRIAWALKMAADPDAIRARREQLELALEHLSTQLGRIQISGVVATNHSRNRDATYALLDMYAGIWRDALLYRAGLKDLTVFPEIGDRVAKLAEGHKVSDLNRALRATRRCMEDLDANIQARIALQAMVMQWPG
jgi:DNA polymerase-3 subunit delta'